MILVDALGGLSIPPRVPEFSVVFGGVEPLWTLEGVKVHRGQNRKASNRHPDMELLAPIGLQSYLLRCLGRVWRVQ